MPVKIRLARHGHKKHAYYHIVVANSRAPRDGRFIERIGSYNPNTNPATIDLDFDKALSWLTNGAQPTDTCRAILSYKGVLMKKHLLEGIKKGAFDEETAEQKFAAWLKEKENAIQAKKDKLATGFEEERKKRLKAEAKINETRLAEIQKKNAAAAAAEAAEAAEATAEAESAEELKEKQESGNPAGEV
jgi:small subunit ribosomal protein S16